MLLASFFALALILAFFLAAMSARCSSDPGPGGCVPRRALEGD